jgi:hypothetical protein
MIGMCYSFLAIVSVSVSVSALTEFAHEINSYLRSYELPRSQVSITKVLATTCLLSEVRSKQLWIWMCHYIQYTILILIVF